jgi:hypothetical protein
MRRIAITIEGTDVQHLPVDVAGPLAPDVIRLADGTLLYRQRGKDGSSYRYRIATVQELPELHLG